ncbi:MAG: hypothetical protein D6706_12150 [Chloroflexi bacterium]|nr:MAG: hypothetical protein D6706_12150 [Chloroflexota bacterium]
MTDLVQQPMPSKRWWHKISQNPVILKELRARMRGRRAFTVLSIYLLLTSFFLILVYMAFISTSSQPFGPDAREAGKSIFSTIVGVQVFLVLFVGPSFTAGAISGEKERQTYELLRTTLLTANEFVQGKLLSALSYVVLLILAAIPLQSLAFLLGGVSLLELFLSQVVLMVTAVAYALYGLYNSATMRSTLSASVGTFAGSVLITFVLPVIVFIVGMILGPTVFGFGATPHWAVQVLLVYGGVILAGINVPASLVVSDIFLIEEDAIFGFVEHFDGHAIWIVSPWVITLVLYTVLSLILYWGTVRKVRQIAE